MSTSRVEAFSDGVIAVAITLLALNLPLPGASHPHLAQYLGRHWPSFVAFAVSFVSIGIVWINHHAMFKRLVAVDHWMLLLNLVLLMTICIMPFTTALMAQYLRAAHGENLAAAIWSGSFMLMSLAFLTIQRYTLMSNVQLLDDHMTQELRRAVWRRNTAGVIPYIVAIAAAALNPYITLVICGAITVFYALPGTTEVAPTGAGAASA